ncbi:MAG: thiamine pyrophosphate-dependent dehydrogenase E1 component subunit alpha [Planctomycetota bacterium]|nr:thiamine pyrophosphate-dependent dehydrogenase E1 component subunit alpha [Planctomycetota bacterium]
MVRPRGSVAASDESGSLPSEALLECHFFMRLAREWDLRFEKLFRTGGVSKWYSSVGHEAVTVPAASCLEAGDALFTLHRDSGAILRYYVDPEQLRPGELPFPPGSTGGRRGDSRELLYRLACQLLGKADGFSGGYERSYHYGYFDDEAGFLHIGMISHLGAMVPVAAGAALAFRQRGSDRVALNFIGDGGTSTGDFHEGLNMAAVLELPLVLVIENNRYAFSTPVRQQCAAESLAARAVGYGIPGERLDGHDPEAVHRAVAKAVERARRGGGPTLLEAVVERLRGHSEGDDSLLQVPGDERREAARRDPLDLLEKKMVDRDVTSTAYFDELKEFCARLILETVDRAVASRDPEPGGDRPVHGE